ncbi:MAG: glycosyltransferase family 39 protein [Candidatus Omnitrophica bacterium]|nr:glycosyltransferase family 39 protein [Candidatus Omnitrophota bacterium]
MNSIRQSVTVFGRGKAIVIAIFLVSLLIRLCFAVMHNEPVIHDQEGYDILAMNLLEYREFSAVKGQPTAYSTPLYPMFLSAIYFFFGHSYLWARIMQALLGSVVCLILYFIAKEVLNKPVALLTMFFMSIHHFFLRYGTLLSSENLFTFWVALSVLFLVKFFKTPSYLYAGLFGLMSSLATLTRSAYFLFPLMAGLFLFFIPDFRDRVRKRLSKLYIVAILCLLFPVSIWTVRNYLVFKTFIPLGTEAGTVFYSSYNPQEEKLLDIHTKDEITRRYCQMPEVEGNRFLLKQTFLAIKREPSKLYKYIPLKLMYFFSVFDWVLKPQGAYNFSTGFILPLFFIGIILMFRKEYSHLNLLVLMPVLYFIFITVAITGVPRTRLPIEPYLIIYAAFFVHYIYKKGRRKSGIISAVAVWYLLNYLFYLNSGGVKYVIRSGFEKIGLW